MADESGRDGTDPSVLTTQQLNMAIGGLREALLARVDGRVDELAGLHGTKIESLEKRLDHKYVETAADISHLRDLLSERISGLDHRVFDQLEGKFLLFDRVFQEHFAKIDQQFHDQTSATALALSAADKASANALGTAEKAVAKAELAAEKGFLESQIAALRNAFTSQISVQKDALEAALASSDKAVLKAEVANEKRFESVNEFRSTLADQQRDLATKSEVNLRFNALEDRVNAVVEDSREIKGRSSVSDPAVSEDVKHLKAMMANLATSRDTTAGVGLSVEKLVPWVIAAGALLLAFLKH